MLSLERNGYSADQVRAALHAPRRRLSFRYELLDKLGAHKADLSNVLGGSVEYNALAEIKRTARLTLRDTGQVDFLSDRIKPHARLHMPAMLRQGGFATFLRNSEARNPDTGALALANAPRYIRASTGLGLLVEEGTPNLAVNPGFEGGTANWVVTGGGVVEQVAGRGGSWRGRITTTGAEVDHSRIYQAGIAVAASTAYTVSCYAEALAASGAVFVFIFAWKDSAGAWLPQNASAGFVPSVGAWQRYSYTATAPANAASVAVYIYVNKGNVVDYAFDDVQIEAKAYATSFVEGTRAAEYLKIPNWSDYFPKGGPFTIGWSGKTHTYGVHRVVFAAWPMFYVDLNGSHKVQFSWMDGTQQVAYGTAIVDATQPHTWEFTYDGTIARVYVDEVLHVETPANIAANPGADGLTIGYGVGYWVNSYVDMFWVRGDLRLGDPTGQGVTLYMDFQGNLDWTYNSGEDVVEFPLGVFIPSTPPRKADAAGVITREVEAYDLLQVLTDDKVPDRYTVAAGTNYITAVKALLDGAGITAQNLTPASSTLPADRDWDPGTPKLRIINDLLDAINYRSLWFDADGQAVAQPYVSPADRAAEYTYQDDGQSVILPEAQESLDLFAVANRWVLTVSEADRPPLRAEYTNANVNSPTSTVSRGRTIVDYRQVEAADQAALDAMASRIAFEASQVYQTVEFETAIMPMHSDSDVLNLRFGPLGLDAKYSEVGWSFDLKAGARMRHRVRRVVTV